MTENLARFQALFAGRDDAYGQYARPAEELAGEKRLAKRWTVCRGNAEYEPLQDKHWQAHLDAVMGLGIVPCRLDATVTWFAFDVDKYAAGSGLHQKLIKKIEKTGLPLVVTRSKSGGAHIWCFLSEPMAAATAIAIMKKWKGLLGLEPKTETFPKQASVEQMDAGSWINLPYFGGDAPYDGRVAIGPRGQTLNLTEFLRFAEARRIAPTDLDRVGQEIEAAELAMTRRENIEAACVGDQGAPPCIQRMLVEGVGEGMRNSALYQAGVYYRKAYPDDQVWQEKLSDFNREKMNPPLNYTEFARIVGSIARGAAKHQYKCPHKGAAEFSGICDKDACFTRQFGIGGGAGGSDDLPKDVVHSVKHVTNPGGESYFLFEIDDGCEFSMTAVELQKRPLFEANYAAALRRWPPFHKKMDWRLYTGMLLEQAIPIEHPAEALSEPTMVEDLFRDWAGKFHQPGPPLDPCLDNLPVYVADEDAIYFKAQSLTQILNKAGLRMKSRELWPIFEKRLGAEHVRRAIGNQQVALFRVACPEPWFSAQGAGDEEEAF